MGKNQILETLESLKDIVRQNYKAEIKGIFGSYSRGEERDDSDLDVLVEFLEGATLFDLTGLGNFLEQKLGCKVDVVSRRALKEELKPYIYDDLVAL
jgi:hypothetical protein